MYLSDILYLSWTEEESALTEMNAWVFQGPLIGY